MANAVRDPRSVLITGASSGIGAALARAYAAPGVTLFLSGRNAERLEQVAAAARQSGAQVNTRTLDVDDREATAAWVAEADATAPLELAIANAGISAGTGSGAESAEQARAIFATNLGGVLNTLDPGIERMRERGRGQIAIVSSLAAFRGFPGAPAYCASKAAVRVWGEALRGHLADAGIGVSVVCPGFVETPMTSVNAFPMPFLMDADRAAWRIKRRLAKDKPRISFPRPLAAAVWLLAALPPGVTDALLSRLPAKD
ncbi:Short-chain dehydrogenase [Limimonas halophila]|uniref:Short-chain dehydrogenase n=1 Tax=Limimonas halophila TaxID=1082479 RepID=A0A1G7MES5_9PROT|nr:SDR family NAD(P)-dependent oxidoreductase [Limimonas halophila]SDF60318.1 Short-chain dehydrogenase [Limimonas halophila]